MKVGILGFSGAGKTTVFNLLTGLHADVGPGGARAPNLGIIKVPDERVERLSSLYQPKKTTFAEIAFVDVAGKAADADKGGLDPVLLTHVRDTDALTLVVRAFPSMMLAGAPDPLRELRELEAELVLADLAVIEKRLERLKKEGGAQSTEALLLGRCTAHLDAELPLRTLELTADELLFLRGFRFLSRKPVICLVNTGDGRSGVPPELAAWAHGRDIELLALCASIEAEVAELDEADRADFLGEYGIEQPARDRFIRAAYAKLDLISFLTTGADEVRAWTIERRTTAVKAAGKVHSDIEKGFIRAEVTPYQILIDLGSEQKVKTAGKLQIEGKDYIVQDGDICHFRFNV